jgi:MFS family permease
VSPVRLPRAVIVLGIASLLTDLSSEMIYPLMPAFLMGVLGAGALAIGVIEGAAETTASALKVASGWWADRARKKKPLVLLGYGISGLARPLIGFAHLWPTVLGLRVLDRVGKGIRTSPRDALIADVVAPEARGRAYGFHRAMDNAGALFGPLVAAALLAVGLKMHQVFWCAAVPAVLVMAVLALGVSEHTPRIGSSTPPSATQHHRSNGLGPGYVRLLACVVLFTLGNSTDAFILAYLGVLGLSPTQVALAWAAHSAVRAAAVYYGGRVADRVDKRRLLVAGWAFYALIYAAFAVTRDPLAIVALLLVYGLYYGAVEPTERALVADLVPAALRGSAFGWFHGAIGLASLPASALFGFLWWRFGTTWAFGAGAVFALVAAALLVAPRQK